MADIEDEYQQAYLYAVAQLQSGADKASITRGLRDMGLAGNEATALMDGVYPAYVVEQMEASVDKPTLIQSLSSMGMTSAEATELVDNMYVSYVVGQLQEGIDQLSIVSNLRKMGLDNTEAANLVPAVHSDFLQVVESERLSTSSMVRGVAGGIGAAIIGGVIWWVIVVVTDYEIGFMAVGLGFLTGFGVLLVSGGKRGVPLQAVAVVSGVLGIVLGKYFLYVYFLRQVVEEQFGRAAASTVTLLSGDVLDAFVTDFTVVFSGWDILWVALAIYTAWKIPSGSGLRIPGQ